MTTSPTFVLISGGCAAALIVLFAIERRRGRRYGEAVRAIFDRAILGIRITLNERFPGINRFFFRQLFFHILHVFASFALLLVQKMEEGMFHAVRMIRAEISKLRKRESTEALVDEHLTAMLEHKKAVELSEREKGKRKAAALRGDG